MKNIIVLVTATLLLSGCVSQQRKNELEQGRIAAEQGKIAAKQALEAVKGIKPSNGLNNSRN